MTERERIIACIREQFPNITLHVSFPGEALDSARDELKAAYGKEAMLRLEFNSMGERNVVATMVSVPVADDVVNVLLFSPAHIKRSIPSHETHVLAHEAARAGLEQLIAVSSPVQEAFPDPARLKTAGSEREALEEEYDRLGDKLVDLALEGTSASGEDIERKCMLRKQIDSLKRLLAEWDAFLTRRPLNYFEKRGISLAEEDVPAFKERVAELYACVETSRHMRTLTAQEICESEADAGLLGIFQRLPAMAEHPPVRAILIESYNTDVLDAAAKEVNVFKGLSGYPLLEACVDFAGKHFTPVETLNDRFRMAYESGLQDRPLDGSLPFSIPGEWLTARTVGAKLIYEKFDLAKILFITRAANPVHQMAVRLALAHKRECDRRLAHPDCTPSAMVMNRMLRFYFKNLLRFGNGEQ